MQVNNAAVLGVKVDSNALDSLADHVVSRPLNSYFSATKFRR